MSLFRWPWRREKRVRAKQEPVLPEEVRRERAAAEQRLSDANRDVIVPLSQMRAVNHVSEDISRLIRRRAGRETEES